MTKITFIGAGSTVFTKNIVGDILQRPALADAEIRLMDIDPQRLAESEIVVGKLAQTLGVPATVKTFRDQRAALDGADFVVVAFQIGGYEPCTVTDFEVPKKFGLRQTIADTLGIGGIMRGLRTVPHLWTICERHGARSAPTRSCSSTSTRWRSTPGRSPRSTPQIRQVGLCHSVQGTAEELARDLDIPVEEIRYRARRHQPHGLLPRTSSTASPTAATATSTRRCARATREGRFPKPSHWNPRCPNKVRYEMLTRLGYFVTESSEHFAEYTPWFIKRDRPDLIEQFGIPLDEYPKRCVEQIARWEKQAAGLPRAPTRSRSRPSHEYASAIVNSVVDRRAVGDLRQLRQPRLHHRSCPTAAPSRCRCLVDAQRPPADDRRATSRRSSSR